jgi:hypothetical protein
MLPTTKQSLRFLLETATPYMRLTLRNIGQRQEVCSCLISYLYANAMQAMNQGVGSSNLSGRAIKSKCDATLSAASGYLLPKCYHLPR